MGARDHIPPTFVRIEATVSGERTLVRCETASRRFTLRAERRALLALGHFIVAYTQRDGADDDEDPVLYLQGEIL